MISREEGATAVCWFSQLIRHSNAVVAGCDSGGDLHGPPHFLCVSGPPSWHALVYYIRGTIFCWVFLRVFSQLS